MPKVTQAPFLCLLLAVAACGPAPVATPIAWTPSYPMALENAIAEEKPLLLYFSAAWCGVCRRLETGALADPRVREALDQYAAVKIDIDRYPAIADQYLIQAVPSLVMANPKQQVLGRLQGRHDAERVLAFLESGAGKSGGEKP